MKILKWLLTKKIEQLKYFFSSEANIDQLIDNLDFIPGIGSEYLEAQSDFTKRSLESDNSRGESKR